MQCHLLPVGPYRARCNKTSFQKVFTHSLLFIGHKMIRLAFKTMECHLLSVEQALMRPPSRKLYNVTYSLSITAHHVIKLPSGELQYHSLPVGCMTRNDDAAIWRNVQCLSLSVSHRVRWDKMRLHFWKMCNDTCFLFIMVEGDGMWFRNMCSLSVWIIEMRLHFWKMCNTTCSLLVMGQNMMRLQLRKITMQLTSCQSLICDSAECAMSLTICWP